MMPETPSSKGAFVFRVYTALNAAGITILLLVVMAQSFNNPHAFFELGALLGLAILFFLIPLGWLAVWWNQRRTQATVPLPQRYLLLSNLFLGAMWVLSCLGVGWYGVVYFVSQS